MPIPLSIPKFNDKAETRQSERENNILNQKSPNSSCIRRILNAGSPLDCIIFLRILIWLLPFSTYFVIVRIFTPFKK
jgi:hypothetical protein